MKSARKLSAKVERLSLLSGLVVGLGLFAANHALAAEYYVATTGSDSNPGTQASPFATLTKGISSAGAGDTVYIGGGTYYPSGGFTFSKSGTSDTNRIKYWAVPGEKPVFDFSKVNGSPEGFTVSGSWLHFKGIEICNLPVNSGVIGINNAHDDIMELMNTHHTQATGIFISHGSGGHLFLNCDSHDNYDPSSAQGDGQNADGFGVHYQAAGDGTSTTIRGCRAWWNSDDGYDFINQEVPVTIENSWSFGNGFSNYGAGRPAAGNGNGFKIGSSKTGIRHLVQNNVAWGNKANGFYANHSSGGNTWYNNTSFQNGTQFNMLASTWSEPNGGGTRTDGVTLTGAKAHILRNNIGYPNKNEYMDASYGVDSQFNTWDLNITPAAKDFLSITDTSVGGTGADIETTSLALGPRQADGSLPNVDFMKLAAGSQMIDKGTNVGLPYVGAAPDLGAYEYGATGGTPTGGVTGAGGATGAAGATGTGGATGAAGATGTGGATGSGGKTGSGGITGTGGATATGGATTATGGKIGSGGATTVVGGKTASSSAPGTGGTTGAGGGTVLGGAPGPGGNTGAGGVMETGGTSGVVDTGGTVETGGAETGGSVATGGQVATGGVPGSAGATAPVETGGAVITGGTSQPGSAGGTTGTTEATGTSGGCSCRIAGRPATGSSGFALLGLLVFALRFRKRPGYNRKTQP
jgi:MYXO-CTERM domain-containing protein